jgi:hypothetical protein
MCLTEVRQGKQDYLEPKATFGALTHHEPREWQTREQVQLGLRYSRVIKRSGVIPCSELNDDESNQ